MLFMQPQMFFFFVRVVPASELSEEIPVSRREAREFAKWRSVVAWMVIPVSHKCSWYRCQPHLSR